MCIDILGMLSNVCIDKRSVISELLVFPSCVLVYIGKREGFAMQREELVCITSICFLPG